MAAERENGAGSDTEVSEKPVREQLQKASISKLPGGGVDVTNAEGAQEDVIAAEDGEETVPRGRLPKKRSIDDLEADTTQEASSDSTRHGRKRSRDSTVEEHELNNGQRKSGERSRDDVEIDTHSSSNGKPTEPSTERPKTPEQTSGKRGEAAVEEMTSPKTKRSRLHSSNEENGAAVAGITDADVPTAVLEENAVESTAEEKAEAPVTASTGFSNTSATSPFAALSGSKSPSAESSTSASAFAASGFSALAGSTSGFGAIGKSSGGFGAGGGFATGSKSPPFASEKALAEDEAVTSKPVSTGGFGGALGQTSAFAANSTSSTGSVFGSSASGFGKLGGTSGFGSGFGGSGFSSLSGSSGLTSFASGKPAPALGSSSKPVKAFGAPADENDEAEAEDDGDSSGFKSPLSQEAQQQDERFYEQELETGEEDEVTEYSCRAKLYIYASVDGKKEWKERGVGTVRVNVKKAAPGEDASKPKARLLMRADGSHRVILNTAVRKQFKFGGDSKGEAPQGNSLLFMGAVDGQASMETMQFKVKPQLAKELYEKITELQEAM